MGHWAIPGVAELLRQLRVLVVVGVPGHRCQLRHRRPKPGVLTAQAHHLTSEPGVRLGTLFEALADRDAAVDVDLNDELLRRLPPDQGGAPSTGRFVVQPVGASLEGKPGHLWVFDGWVRQRPGVRECELVLLEVATAALRPGDVATNLWIIGVPAVLAALAPPAAVPAATPPLTRV